MSRRTRVAYTPRVGFPTGDTGALAAAAAGDSTELRAALNAIPFAVVGETPAGPVNGTNAAFVLSQPAQPGTLAVYVDGKRTAATLAAGVSVTAAVAPAASILVDYQTFGR